MAGDIGTIAQLILSSPIPSAAARRRSRGSPDEGEGLEALERVAMRALEFDPSKRFATAEALEAAVEHAVRPATASEVSRWLREVGGTLLDARAAIVAEVDGAPSAGERSRIERPQYTATELAIRQPASHSGSVPAMETSDRTVTDLALQPRRSRRLVSAAAFAVLAAVFLLAWLGARLGSATRDRGPTLDPVHVGERSAIPGPPATSTLAQASESSLASAAAPAISTAPPPRPAPSQGTRPPPSHTTRPAIRESASATGTATARPPPSSDCHVAFSLGPDGEKIFRQECGP